MLILTEPAVVLKNIHVEEMDSEDYIKKLLLYKTQNKQDVVKLMLPRAYKVATLKNFSMETRKDLGNC